MDRADLNQQLTLASYHITLGEAHIARQRAIIAKLERGGHETAQATELLKTVQKTMALHIADHDRVVKELAVTRFGKRAAN